MGDRLSDVVRAALGAVQATGDAADVAIKLAEHLDARGVSATAVRELRVALVALGVDDLAPYLRLAAIAKAAVVDDDPALASLARQHRETEQIVRQLTAEPANAPTARAVRAAADALVADSRERLERWIADRPPIDDVDAWRARRADWWRAIEAAGGETAFPHEVERVSDAEFGPSGYWQTRMRIARERAGVQYRPRGRRHSDA